MTSGHQSLRGRVGARFALRRVTVGALILGAGALGLVAPEVGTLPQASAAPAPPSAWTAYVTNEIGDTVAPINTATNTTGTPITVGISPIAVAITPNGHTAYVANLGSDNVTPVDTATNTAGTPIPVGEGPDAIAITPNGQTAYVVNRDDGTVTPIDTATNTAGAPIPAFNDFTAFDQGIAITPNGQTAYVANDNATAPGSVTPIDTATNTAGTSIDVGGVIVCGDGTGICPSEAPEGIAVAPNGQTAYVASEGEFANIDDTVTSIDTATNTAGTDITEPPPSTCQPPDGCSGLTSIAITPNGQTAYVVNRDFGAITPLDTATDTFATPITVGGQPNAVAITPNGQTAYVTNEGSNTVTPFDTATNAFGTPIPVVNPHGIAITPDQAPVAHLSVTPNVVGQPSNFDASASTVAFGTIASYAWNFGDGTTATTTSPTTTHTYVTPGTFTASVTETSSGGTSTTQVFTGQTMSQNGGPQAVASASVDVLTSNSNAASQTITFTAPASGTVGGSALLHPSASSGLAVSLSVDASTTNGSCSLSGATVDYLHTGSCVIDANQAGDADYLAAPQVQQTITVAAASQTITFTAPASGTVGGSALLHPKGSSGLAVSLSVDASTTNGSCSLSGDTVNYLHTGRCVIDANQAGDADYLAAPQVQQSVQVAPASQTITFTAPASGTVGGSVLLQASASSGLAVSLSVDASSTKGTCSLSGDTVDFLHKGSCVIDANQSGDADYLAAPQVQQSVQVGQHK